MASSILQEFFIRFGTDTKGFDKSIKNIDTSLSKIGNAFGRLQKIVSLAIGGKVVADMASFGMKMGLLTTQTNIGVKSLTALSSAFESAGSNAQTVQGVLTRLEAGLSGISMGDARIAGVLSTYGINPFDETGRIKTGDEVLLEASDWAKQQRGLGRDERQIRQKLMSDFGVDVGMANLMMMGGRAGIQAEMNRAIAEGRTLSDEAKDSLSKLNIQLKELGGTIKYSLLDSVSTISPLFKEMAVVLKDLAISLNNALKSFVDWAKRKLGDKTFEERMESARLELARQGIIKYKPKDALFEEPKRPEFPELFGSKNNGVKKERDFIITDEDGNILDKSFFGNSSDYLITDEAGNVLDLSQIPYIGSGGNNYDIKVEMTNNIETTSDPEAIGVAVEEKTALGITNALSSNSGG